MADNSSIPVASGNETFANKDIAGVKFPKHIIHDSTGAEVLLATETTLAAMNAKIPATPATTGGQATANAALATLNTTIGAKTDDKSTATDTTSVSAISLWKQISSSAQAIATAIAGTLTVATHAVTQSGSWVLSAGSALIGKVTIGDGTNDAVIRAGSSSAATSDAALVVVNRPDSLADPFAQYEFVAASQTTQALGATGAVGDYLAGVEIFPATAAAGAVSIKDGSNTAITIFAGGGTTALPTLAPIPVPLGIYSTSGAWQITTGADVSAMGIGKFT